jgi:hypothetical protein
MVRWCIEQLRISVDSQDQFNQTALHWAASFNKSTPPQPVGVYVFMHTHSLDSFYSAPAFVSFTFLIPHQPQ